MFSDVALADLTGVLGATHVLVDAEVTAGYRTDWTGRSGGFDAVVVRPGNVDEVVEVVRWAWRHATPIVTQGGNTGLVGASVPGADGACVLSTRRLDGITDLDLAAGQVTVGAGVTVSALGDALAGSGWRFAVDLGARDSATIGGMIATNAGGMRVFRFGAMRAQVLGLEYVTAEGEVVSRLGGLVKDNTGYHLAGLLCGSEGTLAIVTAARLRLIPAPTSVATAVLGFASEADARSAAWELRRSCPELEVIEFVSGECVGLVADTFGLAAPTDAPATLLVEAASDDDPTTAVADAIADLDAAPLDVAVATDRSRRRDLWRFRDDITAALATLGPVVKYDVSVPSDSLLAFRSTADAVVASVAPSARTWWFGHVCDDNVHLNVTGVDPSVVADLDEAVLSTVAGHRGSISAEHGIGRSKAPYLRLARSDAEIAQMRAIKQALDPTGILNPGVLLE